MCVYCPANTLPCPSARALAGPSERVDVGSSCCRPAAARRPAGPRRRRRRLAGSRRRSRRRPRPRRRWSASVSAGSPRLSSASATGPRSTWSTTVPRRPTARPPASTGSPVAGRSADPSRCSSTSIRGGLPEVVDPRDGLLPAVAALVEVHRPLPIQPTSCGMVRSSVSTPEPRPQRRPPDAPRRPRRRPAARPPRSSRSLPVGGLSRAARRGRVRGRGPPASGARSRRRAAASRCLQRAAHRPRARRAPDRRPAAGRAATTRPGRPARSATSAQNTILRR